MYDVYRLYTVCIISVRKHACEARCACDCLDMCDSQKDTSLKDEIEEISMVCSAFD